MSEGLFSMPIKLPGTKSSQALQVSGTYFYRHDACIPTHEELFRSINPFCRCGGAVFIIIMTQIY
jgi:hypothetical protein